MIGSHSCPMRVQQPQYGNCAMCTQEAFAMSERPPAGQGPDVRQQLPPRPRDLHGQPARGLRRAPAGQRHSHPCCLLDWPTQRAPPNMFALGGFADAHFLSQKGIAHSCPQ